MISRKIPYERGRSDRFRWQEGDVEVHPPTGGDPEKSPRRQRIHDLEDGDRQGDDEKPRPAS